MQVQSIHTCPSPSRWFIEPVPFYPVLGAVLESVVYYMHELCMYTGHKAQTFTSPCHMQHVHYMRVTTRHTLRSSAVAAEEGLAKLEGRVGCRATTMQDLPKQAATVGTFTLG